MIDWRAEVRSRVGAEMSDGAVEEMAQHCEDVYREAVANGAEEAAARQQALRGVWPSPPTRTRSTNWLHDLRFAVRGFVRAPGFTMTAIVALGVAIAANTVMFSVAHGVLWKPLRYPVPERLHAIEIVNNKQPDVDP